ncbi:MAG: IS256 family transposase [Patescibacteria group bacterium]|nr:IS256 family transposase [Patescibacteria group bacterium]MDE2589457.1 IS256 family transposase [Patescibacteria group bacterium]
MLPDCSKNNVIEEITKALIDTGIEGLKPIVELLFNASMKVERDHFLKARPYERAEERMGYANGYKPKKIATRFGTLELAIPQVRGLGFYPQSIEKGSRSEKALKLAVAEMYLQGVSTRRVQKITEQLCGLEVSSMQVSRVTKELDEQFELFRNRPLGAMTYVFFDATYLKARHNKMVIDVAVLWAYGITSGGKREILGMSTSLSEAEEHWKEFLLQLRNRGLKEVKLIVSDNHIGLKGAKNACYPGVPWQRCQFHCCQNAQAYASKKSMRKEISETMKEIFNSSTYEMAMEQKVKATEKYYCKAPEFAKWLEENIEEALTVYEFPEEHRVKLRTTNGIERSNRELKRRTKVVGVFPNKESALRLVTARLIEIHEDWLTERHYLDMSVLGIRKVG